MATASQTHLQIFSPLLSLKSSPTVQLMQGTHEYPERKELAIRENL